MADNETNASELIDKKIRELNDWRGKTLSKVRGIIKEADPDVVEEWKWVNPRTPEHRSGPTTGVSAPVRPTRTRSS